MTRAIIGAHRTPMDYCAGYHYSFAEDAVKQNQSPEDWWLERFEHDPLWGNPRPRKQLAPLCAYMFAVRYPVDTECLR